MVKKGNGDDLFSMSNFVHRHNSTKHTTIKKLFRFEKLKIPLPIQDIECAGVNRRFF